MNHSLTLDQVNQLQQCLLLAQNPAQHDEAKQAFAVLVSTLEPDSAVAELIGALWQDLLGARRAAAFWQQISDVEKEMGERLAGNHIQLQQKYLRLVQEQ